MTTAVQRRRGTNTEHSTFTGLDGEITVNTTTYTLHVHDGSTVGGIVLAKADGSNISTSSIDINGGTIDGTVIGGSSAAAGSFTTLTASGEITANGGIALGDNDKATFGESDDLQLYHSGSHSYIIDNGTGDLKIYGANIEIGNASGVKNLFAISGGATTLYNNNSAKLATTSTGVDVTGTVTADGLSVGSAGVNGSFYSVESIYVNIDSNNDSTSRVFQIGRNTTGNGEKLAIFAENGDISFYEDTGTTAKFFWDASAESLGIGTSSPSGYRLHVESLTGGNGIKLTRGGVTQFNVFQSADGISHIGSSGTNGALTFRTGTTVGSDTERMRIDSSGNLLVGGTSQINSTNTSIYGSSSTNCLGIKNANDSNYLITAQNSSNTEVFRVAGTGNVLNTNNSYSGLSDARLKSSIIDAPSQLDDIMSVQVRSYTLNSTGEKHLGVVAQELEASGMSGLVEEDKEGTKSVKYSVLYMKAVKALQEAITKIEDLESRVAQLEGEN